LSKGVRRIRGTSSATVHREQKLLWGKTSTKTHRLAKWFLDNRKIRHRVGEIEVEIIQELTQLQESGNLPTWSTFGV